MYVIYINETPLYLVRDATELDWTAGPERLIGRYAGKSRHLLPYIDMLEKTSRFEAVAVCCTDLDRLIHDFESLYKVIEAAGGLVLTAEEEALFIYRMGTWDLPKGKIEEEESREAAALREVQEETGVEELALREPLLTTLHTYRTRKGKRALKRSYWYRMESARVALTPQTEEEIERAIWHPIQEYRALEGPMYQNIRRVIEQYLKNR